MRRPALSRLLVLAVLAVAAGVSLGLGSPEVPGRAGPAPEATLVADGLRPGSLAAVVRGEGDTHGSLWARRSVASFGSFLLASVLVFGVSPDGVRRARRRPPLRTSIVRRPAAVGRRAPPRALVFSPIA